jgi:predicted O-methyltransferase YrrM
MCSNALFGPNLYAKSLLVRVVYNAAQKIHQRINPAHRAWKRYMRENPTVPWFVPAAVPFLETIVRPEMAVFEWGSGRSTVWLALRGARVVSVEIDAKWAEWVTKTLADRNLSQLVDLRLTAATGDSYADIVRSCGLRFDLVIVDGGYRLECLKAIGHAVKSDGVIVVDNADREDLRPLLTQWSARLIRSFDSGINRTDFYRGA